MNTNPENETKNCPGADNSLVRPAFILQSQADLRTGFCRDPGRRQFFVGRSPGQVISASDADDYITQCQAQIDGKAHTLKTAYDKAKKNYEAVTGAESKSQTAATKAELAFAQKRLTAAATALKTFPTANDYFAGFMPAPDSNHCDRCRRRFHNRKIQTTGKGVRKRPKANIGFHRELLLAR